MKMKKPHNPSSTTIAPFNANDPTSCGYALSFSDDFTNLSTLDVDDTRAEGFNWYLGGLYWATPSAPNSVSIDPNDGLILSDIVCTAALSGGRGTPMRGKAWGGGGYFESMIWFDPDLVEIENGDWPAFWGLSWELLSDTNQAVGKPKGYKHFAELDFMEYGFFNHTGNPANYNFFWQTIHDWYGKDAGRGYSGIANNNVSAVYANAASPDIRGWHRYGCLWIPGSPTNRGSVQAYFDGVPTGGPSFDGSVSWPYNQGNVYPPTTQTEYSILDMNHLIISLQANAIAPMKVRSVKVWQMPGVGTVVTGT